jgi:hypothetical protein
MEIQEQSFNLHPSYYYIGHFSKFIGKDAKELAVYLAEAH